MAAGEQVIAVVDVGGALWALRSRPGVSSTCVPIAAADVDRLNRRTQLLANGRRGARTTVIPPIPVFTIPADTGGITEEPLR